MRPYARSPSRTYGCPSMTTTHKFDQCSPASGSVVIILMVLASRNTDGSHPATALPSPRAALANAIDKTNKNFARLAIRHFFILASIDLLARYIRHSTADRSIRAMLNVLSFRRLSRPGCTADKWRFGLGRITWLALWVCKPLDVGGSLSMDSKQIPV